LRALPLRTSPKAASRESLEILDDRIRALDRAPRLFRFARSPVSENNLPVPSFIFHVSNFVQVSDESLIAQSSGSWDSAILPVTRE
jgi:hypothetical protein